MGAKGEKSEIVAIGEIVATCETDLQGKKMEVLVTGETDLKGLKSEVVATGETDLEAREEIARRAMSAWKEVERWTWRSGGRAGRNEEMNVREQYTRICDLVAEWTLW